MEPEKPEYFTDYLPHVQLSENNTVLENMTKGLFMFTYCRFNAKSSVLHSSANTQDWLKL